MIRVISIAYNRADFIGPQWQSFQKFAYEPLELIVVNNAAEQRHIDGIDSTCAFYGVRSVKCMMQDQTLAGLSHQAALRHAWKYLIQTHDDICVLVDHDIFMYAPCDFRSFADGYGFCGVRQGRARVQYLWPGLLIVNRPVLPDPESVNLDGGVVEGQSVDSGGMLHHYLKAHPEIQTRGMRTTSQIVRPDQLPGVPDDMRNWYDLKWGFEFIEGAFLHFARGSNWSGDSPELMADRMKAMTRFLGKRITP